MEQIAEHPSHWACSTDELSKLGFLAAFSARVGGERCVLQAFTVEPLTLCLPLPPISLCLCLSFSPLPSLPLSFSLSLSRCRSSPFPDQRGAPFLFPSPSPTDFFFKWGKKSKPGVIASGSARS